MRQLDDRHDRRTLLRGIGVTLLGVGLAGCTGPGEEEEDEEEDGDENGEEGGDGEDGEEDERLRQPDPR